jgi:hypothetical protein
MMAQLFARFGVLSAAVLLLAAAATPASADSLTHAQKLDRMMRAIAAQSARDGATITRLYRPHLDFLLLDAYSDLEGALATGGLAPLPAHPSRFNLAPRLDGPHPIGEKDLGNQANYLAARPATIGALIVVASRVRSGPVEITSLVRHAEYQAVLRTTNGNASTSVPMHTMGLAFDIALVNTPFARAQEIRRVLQEMRAAGDILFIGERHQLVFHVVPHPSRLGYFTGIYHQAVGAVSGLQAVEVVAPGPPRLASARLTPRVIAEVVAISPLSDQWQEWTDAQAAYERGGEGVADARDGMADARDGMAAAAESATTPLAAMVLMRGLLAFLAALGTSVWRIANRSRA